MAKPSELKANTRKSSSISPPKKIQTVGTYVTLERKNHSICGKTRLSKKLECTNTTPDYAEARDRLTHRRPSLISPPCGRLLE